MSYLDCVVSVFLVHALSVQEGKARYTTLFCCARRAHALGEWSGCGPCGTASALLFPMGLRWSCYPSDRYCAADAITPCEPWPILYNIIIKLSSNHTVGSFIMCRTRPCVDQSLHITESMTQSSRSLERKVDHFRSNPFISEWSVLLYTT